jgi:translation initiation factor 3 subunit C
MHTYSVNQHIPISFVLKSARRAREFLRCVHSHPPTMSRFFKGEGSSSESEEESQDSDENVEQQTRKAPTRTYDSSSDDEDAPVKRVVQSQQAKLAQEYDALITKIKSHIKTNEFTAFQGGIHCSNLPLCYLILEKKKKKKKKNNINTFTNLHCKDLDKLDKALQKSVQKGDAVPRAYIKAICMLEDHVAKTVESGMKLNAVNQKALNTFKQKFKKHNVPYQKQIAEYREVLSHLHFLPLFSQHI